MFLPIIKATPHSFTYFLFVVYVIGLCVCMTRYLLQYHMLRKMLSQRHKTDEQVIEQVKRVSKKYKLKTCQIMTVDNFPSVFLCGLLLPLVSNQSFFLYIMAKSYNAILYVFVLIGFISGIWICRIMFVYAFEEKNLIYKISED